MVVQWSIFLVDGRRRLGGGWIGSSILLAITVINLVLFGLAVPFAWRATSALGERRLDLGLAASLAGSVNAQLDIGS